MIWLGRHYRGISHVLAGFGRIGRLVLRIASSRDDIDVVAVNDPFVMQSTCLQAYIQKRPISPSNSGVSKTEEILNEARSGS
ncbi:hypothetical protein RHMOL_Rhmol10G0000300 [Rhododendron molle]|uniref:Uncharacterized protein n=1 Tax=Rhododendron molle TaxID=49168 RepID=A0ACC0LX57_RHOML|nr:hypothetical protein RHMOL_Rhmol10G0000300 [Rhododendron molle]